MDRERKICVVVSSPMTVAAFLRDQLRALGERYSLSVVANAPDGDFLKKLHVEARFVPAPIERKIRPWTDLAAFLRLFLLFVRERFQIVHSVTPKAGLLAMSAACLAGIPCRIHIFTGQVWATKTGFARTFLRLMDKILAAFATHVLVDSASQREFLILNRVVSREKSAVLGAGSISGVDTHRFQPDPEARREIRGRLGIPMDDLVFLYVGRLNRDKGIPELVAAFEKLASMQPGVRLMIVGPDEEEMGKLMDSSPARHLISREGYTSTPEHHMAAGDVFVLPSHREGFGSTIIEAAATGLPAVASRIYGLTDAVYDGRTGLLHDAGDTEEIARAMLRLAREPDTRARLAEEARKRALAEFSMERVTGNTLAFYESVTRPL